MNGVRLNYLDWGEHGEVLVLIRGSRESPHAFDGIAPQLNDRFRVVAYARRGDMRSESKGPYDVDTMVEDLRQLLDKLGILKANLAGWWFELCAASCLARMRRASHKPRVMTASRATRNGLKCTL